MLIKSNNTSVIPKHQHMKIINRNGPLEIIALVYDTALDRWTGEEWFGRLKKQRETLVLGHGTLLLGPSGFAGKEFWAAAEFRLRRPPPSPPRRWVTRMRHFGLQTPSISSSFHFVPLPLLSASSARGRWPPLLVQRSATYHIISFRLVGRVKLPHQAPARRRPRGRWRPDSVPQPTGPFRPPPPSMGAPPRTVKRTSRPGLSFTARPHGGCRYTAAG